MGEWAFRVRYGSKVHFNENFSSSENLICSTSCWSQLTFDDVQIMFLHRKSWSPVEEEEEVKKFSTSFPLEASQLHPEKYLWAARNFISEKWWINKQLSTRLSAWIFCCFQTFIPTSFIYSRQQKLFLASSRSVLKENAKAKFLTLRMRTVK